MLQRKVVLLVVVLSTAQSKPTASFFKCDCGHMINTPNVGFGSLADLNEFPWMAGLFVRTDQGDQFRCAGSIINENYILSASHCFAPNLTDPNDWVIHVGQQTLDKPKTCIDKLCSPEFQTVEPSEIITHEKYNGFNLLTHDIALIRTKRPIALNNENIQPVCLPLSGEEKEYKFEVATVAGWGLTEHNKASTELLKGDFKVVADQDCNKFYKHRFKGQRENTQLGEGHLCVDSKSFTCYGDSGGPLVVSKKIDKYTNKYYQYGVVSFGPEECTSYEPMVQTKVAHYTDWIMKNVKA